MSSGLGSGTRVLIAERHAIFRAGLRAICEGLSLVVVVGEATTASDAVAMTRRSQPDCVLLDSSLGDGATADLIRQLRVAGPRSAVVVLSLSSDPLHVLDAIGAGASAYLLKDVPTDQLAVAIDRTTSGEAFVDPVLAGRVVKALSGHGATWRGTRPEPLTAREVEVLKAISRGRSNKEIAFDLHLRAGTVKVYVERILRKLTANNRVEATTRALHFGLISSEDAPPPHEQA